MDLRREYATKIVSRRTKRFLDFKKNMLALALLTLAGFLGVGSVIFNSIVLVMFSIGFAVWATLLLLLMTQKVVAVSYVGPILVESTVLSDSLLSQFGYSTQAVIRPPISSGNNPILQIFEKGKNSKSISISPIGLDFVFRLEKKSPIELFSLEFADLPEFLSKMVVDGFELAGGFEMLVRDDLIYVKVQDFIFQDSCKQIRTTRPSSCERLLCPFCSSLACIISKVTHKSVSFDKMSFESIDRLEICFRTH